MIALQRVLFINLFFVQYRAIPDAGSITSNAALGLTLVTLGNLGLRVALNPENEEIAGVVFMSAIAAIASAGAILSVGVALPLAEQTFDWARNSLGYFEG